MITTDEGAAVTGSILNISDTQWSALSERRVLFGHQSVGGNIVAGISELIAEHPQITLALVESRNPAGKPAFYHTPIGRNRYPLEKLDDFASLASQSFGTDGGIAMMKLCYIDIEKSTDPKALFAQYKRTVDRLKAQNPALTIVHFTLPLTGIENWKGLLRAKLTGTTTDRERNVIRHQYNELLRAEYGEREPVFDIARLESTLPDGRRVYFRASQDQIPMLADLYTNDGGHLNQVGRRRVAEQLLILLAKLSSRPRGMVATERDT